jgi:hypothetical protein
MLKFEYPHGWLKIKASEKVILFKVDNEFGGICK